MNQLILGDNLEILKSLSSESIDLIYLDPPFFSNRNYEVIWGDKGEIRSFEDRWAGGIDHYISWLKERVAEMHRLLKPTGSIYLHCDHHANAYIRVDILDKVFGYNNFGNEIIWYYENRLQRNSKTFSHLYDSIFLYTKSDTFFFQKIKDEDWKPSNTQKRRLSNGYEIRKGILIIYDEKKFKSKNIDKNNYKKVTYSKTSQPPIGDSWNIPILNPMSKERIGYPTQKPEKLIERIIKASSNENDVVMDPFLGGGTTVAVADKLNRQWIGIDQSVQAIKVSEMRLHKHRSLFSLPFSLQLHKYDYDDLRNKPPFEFEKWIIGQFGGESNIKQRSDMGIDGKKGNVPIQVKQSESVGRNVVDNFLSAIRRFDIKMFAKAKEQRITTGYLIGFSFGKGAIQEVARLKNKEYIYIELVEVGAVVPLSRRPRVKVTFKDLGLTKKDLREIEFKAVGESDNGIEFYAWDWNYTEKAGFKASIYRDTEGIQRYAFSSGSHSVGVKCVDEAGLECLEIVNLRINGYI